MSAHSPNPQKTIIQTNHAPAAIGPYSQAVKVGHTVYASGQIPLDPATMQVVPGGIEAEAEQVFKNLKAVAKAAGGSLADVVQLSLYLTNLADFDAVNRIMMKYFSEPYPARATVEVSALPKGVAFEAAAILHIA